MVSSNQISERQQTSLALQRTNAVLKSKVQELLTELNHTNEQLCPEKTSHQRTQKELQKYLSLLQATLDSTAHGVIAISFLTTKTSKAEVLQGIKLEANDYFIKPSTVEELLKALAACLEKQATLQQWYATQSQRNSELPCADTATLSVTPKSILPFVPKLREVFDFIEANYHQPITLCDVAKVVGYSPTYLTSLVRCQTGQTVHCWIVERRMAEARSLLLKTDWPVNQIAAAVGYPDSGHFIRQFRRIYNTTPKMWRNMGCVAKTDGSPKKVRI